MRCSSRGHRHREGVVVARHRNVVFVLCELCGYKREEMGRKIEVIRRYSVGRTESGGRDYHVSSMATGSQ